MNLAEMARKYSSDTGCAICGGRVYGATRLAGNYTAALCLEHANEWNLFCREHEAFTRLQQLEVRLGVAIARGGLNEALGLRTRLTDATNEMYRVAAQWVRARATQERTLP